MFLKAYSYCIGVWHRKPGVLAISYQDKICIAKFYSYGVTTKTGVQHPLSPPAPYPYAVTYIASCMNYEEPEINNVPLHNDTGKRLIF